MAAPSKAWVCGRSLAGIVDLNPTGEWKSVSCMCCVMSRKDLCVGLITRPRGVLPSVVCPMSVIVKSRKVARVAPQEKIYISITMVLPIITNYVREVG